MQARSSPNHQPKNRAASDATVRAPPPMVTSDAIVREPYGVEERQANRFLSESKRQVQPDQRRKPGRIGPAVMPGTPCFIGQMPEIGKAQGADIAQQHGLGRALHLARRSD